MGQNLPQPETPPGVSTAGVPASGPLTGTADRKNASSAAGGRSSRVRSSSVEGVREGGEGREGTVPLPPVETRTLNLKNHFPVAMRLMSVAMEDCQVRGIVFC